MTDLLTVSVHNQTKLEYEVDNLLQGKNGIMVLTIISSRRSNALLIRWMYIHSRHQLNSLNEACISLFGYSCRCGDILVFLHEQHRKPSG